MARGHVAGVPSTLDYDLALIGLERMDDDLRVVPVAAGPESEEHVFTRG
ncbi:MAG TPA: hypothetical protein VLK65_17890 [Vicinamibacteria bacterium]|nr:hypothetical protein [Vicinamibacteria bacterium]